MELHFPILLDGATGTELQKRGYRGGISAEQWVLEHPDAIKDLHNNYMDAGSDVLYAPTFGANRVKLEEYGVFNQVEDYNRRLAKIALDHARGRALVAGDISQTGKFLKPIGNTTFREMLEIYREQAEALEEAGVNLYAVETMSNLAEARAAVLAIRQVSDKPIMVCFTCEANGRTVMGNDIAAAAEIRGGAPHRQAQCGHAEDEERDDLLRLRSGGAGLLREGPGGCRRGHFRKLLRLHGGAHSGNSPGTSGCGISSPSPGFSGQNPSGNGEESLPPANGS